MGAYMMEQLEDLIEHPYVGEVRGKGLLVGIELVGDKETKEPLASDITGRIVSGVKEQKVIIGRNGNTVPGLSNVILTAPPLTIQQDDADKIVNAIKTSLNNVLP